MNSPSLVAGSPAVERAAAPERVPTDWKTGAMQKRIRRRYAAERRFHLFGLAAVVLSGGFLAFLLVYLKQVPTWREFAGLALIIAGVAVAISGKRW